MTLDKTSKNAAGKLRARNSIINELAGTACITLVYSFAKYGMVGLSLDQQCRLSAKLNYESKTGATKPTRWYHSE